ncbi:Alpha-D-kanosaminyltransferase [Planctomycetes bacterium Poly30]|uniref:Alpha-D-kanosaminyltransferase n=1 Tax=Saltatorellus ferox TaxID=2528018 RepID=A0A518EVV2_9BACT|nr:Alpha-D-kanosaminyltransferase [Planctomycetes bacterium Poly30]
MRILYVTHLYPPEFTAGVEVFAQTTAELLQGAGHVVRVITTRKDIARRDLSTREIGAGEGEGVTVMEMVNNLFATEFEETYRQPEIDAIVGAELDAWKPDVVHVHHLLYLSSGILEVCQQRGIPVVMTLHDFWLGCARFGQLVHANGSRCVTVDPVRCGTCLPSLNWRQSNAARRLAKAVSAVAETAGIDLKAPLIMARRFKDARSAEGVAGSEGPEWSPPSESVAGEFESHARQRLAYLTELVNRTVDRIVLPAAFMRPWFANLGLDATKMVVETTGVDWEGATSVPRVVRRMGDPVRFLFLGSLVAHKGAHVLLQAWSHLSGSERASARLRICGPDQHQPAYVSALRSRAAALDLAIEGQLSREEVRQAMAETDVLVVPSLWLEIRPLVMLEAYAAGARVIATDLGGMREAIDDGLPGRVVPEGDATELAHALREELRLHLAEEIDPAPERKPSSLFRGWPEVAASLEALYQNLVSGKGDS